MQRAQLPCVCPTMIPFAFISLHPPQSNTGWREEQFSPSWHVLPVHWGGQIHLNPSTRSWQVPPWPQGFGEQSSISVKQSKERLRLCVYSDFYIYSDFSKSLLLFNSSVKWDSKHRRRSLHLWPFGKWQLYFGAGNLSKQYFKQRARMLQKFSVLLLSRSHWLFFPLVFNKNLGISKGEESAQWYKWLPRTNAEAGKS